MDLNKLMVFSKVAEYKSFTKAAEYLGIEKSTASTKVSELEKALGAQLLTRTTRTVALTEIGEGYFDYCQRVISKAQEAEEFVRAEIAEPQGLLRISVPERVGKVLSDDLSEFLKKYPKVSIELCVSNQIIDLERDNFDLALRISGTKLSEPGLISKPVMKIELGLFASPEFVAENDELTTPQTLLEKPLVTLAFYNTENPLVWQKTGFKISSNSRIISSEIDVCIKAIKNGIGIGLLPVEEVKQGLEEGSIVQIVPSYPIYPAYLFAVYSNRKWLSYKLRVFLKFLEEWSFRRKKNR